MTRLDGRCHCGNIRFEFRWSHDDVQIPVRKCACDFCTDHAAGWTSDNNGSLSVSIRDDRAVSRYRFGTESAEFLICCRCGVVPVAVSRIDGADYAVVNTNTFNDKDSLMREPSQTDFDGELLGDRLARRKKNWIANVSIVCAGGGESVDC